MLSILITDTPLRLQSFEASGMYDIILSTSIVGASPSPQSLEAIVPPVAIKSNFFIDLPRIKIL